jgi:hypothetical protein
MKTFKQRTGPNVDFLFNHNVGLFKDKTEIKANILLRIDKIRRFTKSEKEIIENSLIEHLEKCLNEIKIARCLIKANKAMEV